MQESYLPLKPSHAPDTSDSYTSVTLFGATSKDFSGNMPITEKENLSVHF